MIALVISPDAVKQVDVSTDLKTLQSLVGGLIEHVPVGPAAHLWVNEEGRLLGLPFNPEASAIAGRFLVGTAVLCGTTEDGEDTDLPAEWRVV